MPLKMKEEYYKPIENDLQKFFLRVYWEEILKEVEESKRVFNSNSYLVSAIRLGKVYYSGGVFSGQFNSRISRELSKFATFDKRSKTWKGVAPPEVSAAAAIANERGKRLNLRITSLIEEIPGKVSEAINSLQYSIDTPFMMMEKRAGKDLETLGISVKMTPELRQNLIENYTNNMDLNIKNWTEEQIVRLRDLVEKNSMAGYNKYELINLIANEFDVSMRKAKFLARQETSLFMAEVRDTRYKDAGIQKFRWSATGGKAGDGRTRDLHRELHGQVFFYSSLPIIDEKTGERGVPGQAFGCRCTAIPVL